MKKRPTTRSPARPQPAQARRRAPNTASAKRRKAAAGPARKFDTMRAAHVMATEVVTVKADTSLPEVHRILTDNRIGGVPVTDMQGKLVGVLSVRDLVEHDTEPGDERVRTQRFYDDGEDLDEQDLEGFELSTKQATTAGDIMTSGVLSVAPDTSLGEVASAMVRYDVHRLIVQDRGRLVGIVSAMDVLRAVAGGNTREKRGAQRAQPRG